jgi:nickel-dependent lactate racemase
VSEGVLRESMPDYDIPVEIDAAVAEGGYAAIFSVGQVVPHEVIGMANGIKNILVGTGGQETINKSHFLGAAYGMERMMGRARTPVRDVMNYAHEQFLAPLGIVYVMTVMERASDGQLVMRGIFVGDGPEAFEAAAELSRKVNVNVLPEAQPHVVAYMEPREFQSTWLSNKAVYRTRMAIADDGLLTVLAPGVRMFGEDAEIDRLIRRYGYHGTPATLQAVAENAELRANLSAAAHLIHGSSEGRFRIVYATDPDLLSRDEVEGVGFDWRDVHEALDEFGTGKAGKRNGFYYVPEPALGLWAAEGRWADSRT